MPTGSARAISPGVWRTDPRALLGDSARANPADFGTEIDWRDHKIAFVTPYVTGKDVLDIGCIDHDPENSRSRYWLHGAIRQKARSVLGLDLYAEGVEKLRAQGFNIVVGDAQIFDLGRKFDVIVAGSTIAHLEDLHGFLESCKRHLAPDGRLLISTDNPWYWRYVARAAIFAETCTNREQVNWNCPATLRQLVERHGMKVHRTVFGSRYLRDRIMPLPRGWKHTSFHAEIGIAT